MNGTKTGGRREPAAKPGTAAVIGAGLGGLACAARLAAAGWTVDLYERRVETGGKAGSVRIGGYRFDTGPSLFTMRHVFEELFADCGERMDDHLSLIPLDRICGYRFADGTELSSWADVRRFGQELAEKTGERPDALARYLAFGKGIWDISSELFLERSLHEAATWLSRKAAGSMLQSWRMGLLSTLHGSGRRFFRDPRTVQLFDRYATYNGSDPYRAPGTLAIIPWVEYGLGAWAVRGGIRAVPDALTALAARCGVRMHRECPVERIVAENGRAAGVGVGGERIPYRAVIANADVQQVYGDLLRDPDAPQAKRYRALEPSSSAVVFLWGMGSRFPELGTHSIFFSADYREEFRDIFGRGRLPSDPTVYVNITSRHDPQDAPPGGENWFVLVNAPWNAGQDWLQEARALRSRVLAKLERALGRSVADAIEVERVMTPRSIEEETGSFRGSLYGISSNSRGAAFLRHPNRSRRCRGLYFCGGSAHPGGGMPLALLSGRIAADLVMRYET